MSKNFYSGVTGFWYYIREHPIIKRLKNVIQDVSNKSIVFILDEQPCEKVMLIIIRTCRDCFRVMYEDKSKTFRKANLATEHVKQVLIEFYDKLDFKTNLNGRELNLYFAGLIKYKFPFKENYIPENLR